MGDFVLNTLDALYYEPGLKGAGDEANAAASYI